MTEPTDDLVAFIRARLDEDEAVARNAPGGPWRADDSECCIATDEEGCILETGCLGYGSTREVVVRHVTRHDPARVLRGVEAKRRILAAHGPTTPAIVGGTLDYPDAAKLCGTCGPGDDWQAEQQPYGHVPCYTVRLLAIEWSDHSDYREEWRA